LRAAAARHSARMLVDVAGGSGCACGDGGVRRSSIWAGGRSPGDACEGLVGFDDARFRASAADVLRDARTVIFEAGSHDLHDGNVSFAEHRTRIRRAIDFVEASVPPTTRLVYSTPPSVLGCTRSSDDSIVAFPSDEVKRHRERRELSFAFRFRRRFSLSMMTVDVLGAVIRR